MRSAGKLNNDCRDLYYFSGLLGVVLLLEKRDSVCSAGIRYHLMVLRASSH